MTNGMNDSSRKFWTPLRIGSSLIVLGLFAMFGVSSCNSTDVPAPTSNTPSTSSKATANLTPLTPDVLNTQLQSANGSPFKIADYSGKVILVNLWATWCGPCKMEIPELVKIHKEFQDRGVEMIGLSTEPQEDSAEAVRYFVREFNMDYKVGWSPQEVSLELMQGRQSIPQSFVITRDGKILKRFIGFSPRIVPQLRQALEEALSYSG
jgi:thiol-disulfide isomerase/thioredoxin